MGTSTRLVGPVVAPFMSRPLTPSATCIVYSILWAFPVLRTVKKALFQFRYIAIHPMMYESIANYPRRKICDEKCESKKNLDGPDLRSSVVWKPLAL
ncbi:unnamed protein product [Nezara viridula]|uniref:Uncharacterized protein n=1 Tax=Nezara viridula TaxID=85310 RepID=A0A9P0H2S8_NEZVI|nr:unnamed protein product [Nezara viridula]